MLVTLKTRYYCSLGNREAYLRACEAAKAGGKHYHIEFAAFAILSKYAGLTKFLNGRCVQIHNFDVLHVQAFVVVMFQ
jgi:hypothetical protein